MSVFPASVGERSSNQAAAAANGSIASRPTGSGPSNGFGFPHTNSAARGAMAFTAPCPIAAGQTLPSRSVAHAKISPEREGKAEEDDEPCPREPRIAEAVLVPHRDERPVPDAPDDAVEENRPAGAEREQFREEITQPAELLAAGTGR